MTDGIESALERSRAARAAGDGETCRLALAEAQALAGTEDPARTARIAWRRAKAEHDFGSAEGIAEALTAVVDLADPFTGSEAALSATEVLTRRMRDEQGYQPPLPDRLLMRAAEAWRERDDPIRALWVEVQLAWGLACRGDLPALFDILQRAERLVPKDIARSPSRHARASDAESSLAWMQLDLARAALRGATWTRNRDRSLEAMESLEDAAEDAGLRRLADPWFLEASITAAWQFGTAVPPGYTEAWPRALASLDGPRGHLHRKLHEGWASLRTVPNPTVFAEAATLAADARLGPEWQAWAWTGAEQAGDDLAAQHLASIVRDRGVLAFADH